MNTWVLWGQYKGTPLRIMEGSLAEVSKERSYRMAVEANPAPGREPLRDIRVRKLGQPYDMAQEVTA